MSYFLGKLVYFTERVELRMQHACATRRDRYKDLKCVEKQAGRPRGPCRDGRAPESSPGVLFFGES